MAVAVEGRGGLQARPLLRRSNSAVSGDLPLGAILYCACMLPLSAFSILVMVLRLLACAQPGEDILATAPPIVAVLQPYLVGVWGNDLRAACSGSVYDTALQLLSKYPTLHAFAFSRAIGPCLRPNSADFFSAMSIMPSLYCSLLLGVSLVAWARGSYATLLGALRKEPSRSLLPHRVLLLGMQLVRLPWSLIVHKLFPGCSSGSVPLSTGCYVFYQPSTGGRYSWVVSPLSFVMFKVGLYAYKFHTA